jgi:glucosylceramidase
MSSDDETARGSDGAAILSRRRMLEKVALCAAGGLSSPLLAAPSTAQGPSGIPGDAVRPAEGLRWVVTTQQRQWHEPSGARAAKASPRERWDVEVRLDRPLQTIDGFGACFNELGWLALSALREPDRDAVLRELFAPGVGSSLTLCRMPLGANDFSRDWYSYDETPGDFGLRDFSIANDIETLVPFIKAARGHQPALKLWASPWSPPTWMKKNGHYATRMSLPGQPPNGLRPDQAGTEGQDMFIQEERYFVAYAAYFARFVEEYRKRGIPVGMVMPQNEFNSNQPFPSCCWSPEGLARFIPHLGGAMERLGVEVFLGTMERPNAGLLAPALGRPESRRHIKGIGIQWAGKHALSALRQAYPELKIYETEQECGDSRNDWRYCRYAWTLMRKFLEAGASAYEYWNIALLKGGVSRWGWAQNSLVTVDAAAKTYTYNYEYYLLKHLSHFVPPGARRLDLQGWTGYENLLAFQRPDRGVVVMAQNDMCDEMPIRIKAGEVVVSASLPADSFSTFQIAAASQS